MPARPARPCTYLGCRALSRDGSGRCPDHPREAWAKPGPEQSTTERGYGWAWQQLRLRILERDNYLCQACKKEGRLIPAKDVDHIQRKEDGGTDDETNLQSLCRPCHKAKTQEEKKAGLPVRRGT